MTQAEFHKGVRDSVAIFDELGLLEQPNWFSSLEPGEEFRKVAYDSTTPYADVYRAGLQYRAYNLLLSDFAYLQFYRSEDRGHVDLRYAYYPNPFNAPLYSEFREQYGVGDVEGEGYEIYLQVLDESVPLGRSPAVRYDVAFGQYRELVHPAAHLHFGLHEDNRWPVSRVLTPDAFSLLIAKHFYLHAWLAHEANPQAGRMRAMDLRFCTAKAACAPLAPAHFSADEARQLYLC
jgi:hypothetical protein